MTAFAITRDGGHIVYLSDEDIDERFDLSTAVFSTDGDLDGILALCDCAASDPDAWRLPGEAVSLALTYDGGAGTITLRWAPPFDPGSTAVYYEVPFASAADDFGAPVCLADGTVNTQVTTLAPPGSGYFLVRVENVCGAGSVGRDGSGDERLAGPCP